MSALERNLARDSLRTQAAALMDELRRLKLVAALTRGLLRPLSGSTRAPLDWPRPYTAPIREHETGDNTHA